MRKIFSALDIGSSTIKLVCGEFINNKLNVLGASQVLSYGYTSNYIYNKETLKESIIQAKNKLEDDLQVKINKVILNIPCNELNYELVEDSTNIENNVVSSSDIVRLLKNVSNALTDKKNELICTLPITFKVDDNEYKRPFGKHGNILSVKCILVSTDKKTVYDLVNLVGECDLDIIDITTTGLVDYYNFKNNELDSKNIVVVNLGYTTTNISVFSKGIFINNKVLENGGFYIDKEIAGTFNIKRKDVIYLKEKLSLASMNNANKENIVQIVNKNNEEITINQEELSEIVSNGMNNLMKLVKKNINLLTKKEISYIIITGGLSEVGDINLLINEEFNKNGKIGKINNLGARKNDYSVALGMLKYFNEKLILRNKEFSSMNEDDIDTMCSVNVKNNGKNSIISKVVGYFFDE